MVAIISDFKSEIIRKVAFPAVVVVTLVAFTPVSPAAGLLMLACIYGIQFADKVGKALFPSPSVA